MKYLRCTRWLLFLCVSLAAVAGTEGTWQTLDPEGRPHPRHEAAFVECDGKFYLLGGRRIQPVDIYDPKTNSWSVGKKPPVEIHHFQPVVWRNRIILAGAMTGKYPHETALPRLVIYDPAADEWTYGAEIPEGRRRGGAGAVIADAKLYLVAGIINGHWDGHVSWLDAFDLETGRSSRTRRICGTISSPRLLMAKYTLEAAGVHRPKPRKPLSCSNQPSIFTTSMHRHGRRPRRCCRNRGRVVFRLLSTAAT